MADSHVSAKGLALTVGALLIVAAGVMLGARREPSTQVQPPATPPVSQALAPAGQPVRPGPSEKPAPAAQNTALPTDLPPSSGPVSVDTDTSPLRLRALTLPVQGVTAAQLSDTYTQARAAGVPHEAIDIMSPRGTPVLAVEDGKVAKLFVSKPGGITLYQFDPDNRYAYYYAHLDRYAEGVAEGSILRKGQVIAYVGSTGNASPDAPHLHFAIFKLGPERQWWRGTPLNPYLVWREPKP